MTLNSDHIPIVVNIERHGFVEVNLARGEYTLSAFLDVKGAVNNITISTCPKFSSVVRVMFLDVYSLV